MKKKVIDFTLCCMMLFTAAKAQTKGYLYEATIDSIKQSGFYDIVLTPAISAHLKTDLSDFRIVNGAGKWIPHLIRKPNSERNIERLIMNLLIINKETKAAFTDVIVKTDGKKLSNLVLQIKNTDAERFCSLAGSDNLKEWFTINDSILIQPQQSEGNTATFSINFPQVNYKYFKITIDNRNRAPFNITGVGYQALVEGPGISIMYPSIENPLTSLIQKDSGKISYIKVVQNDPYHFDEIQLKINGPTFFNRTAEIYLPAAAAHAFNNPGKLVHSFTISNNSSLQYKFPAINTTVFYLLIHNKDNLPLKVDTVKTSNTYGVATAYLETANSYKILLDNISAEKPDYDLQQLNIANKNSLSHIEVGNIVPAPQDAVALNKASNNKWMIWIIIAIAATALAFFTYKLITEMNKSKG